MTDLAAIMETFDCRQQYFNGESNVDDVQADVKRGDVDFKRNLLSLKSEVEFDDEINVDNDDVEEEENAESDDGDSDEYYGECYDGPFQFLSDDYDECDFTPQELQEFMFQQQQQTMYSLRRYSLLETIQEETSDELRMSSVSDESCRSDYSGVWCWGDDYPDDGSESVVVTRQQQQPHPQQQQQEDPEPVFDSDLEENPLSDREGSWLDLDDHSLQPDVTVKDDENTVDATDDERELLLNSPVNDISPAVRGEGEAVTEVSSWSDAIDAYLMSRVSDKAVGRKSCTGSRSLSGNDLSFNSCVQDKRDATVTSEESASSSAEDGSIGSRFCIGVTSRSVTRLSGVKSDPNLFQRDVTDDCYVSPPPRYVDDDFTTLKKVSNFSSFGNSDVIGWNDDVNKSQSLPCVNVDRCDHQSSNRSISESQVTPSIASHLDQTDISCSNFGDVSLFVYEDEDIEEEEEEDDFSSDESDDNSTLYRNRSQPLLPFLRFARPASLRSFRSFDTSLNLAGMTEQADDDFDDVVEEDAEDVGTGSSSSTNLRSTSKSCEDLSEDSGCCDLAVISTKITNYLQETPEDEEEEEDSGFVTVESSKVEEILDPTSSVSSPTIQLTGSSPSGKKSPEMHEREEGGVGIWVGEDDENDQFRVSYRYRNASEETQMCSADVYNSKTSLKNDSHDVTTGLNQVNAIVLQQAIMNNGSGSCNVLPIANADAQNNGGSSIDNLTSFHQSHVTTEFSSPPQQQLGPPEQSSSSSNDDEEDENCGVKATNLISTLKLLEPSMMSEIRHFNSPLGHVSDEGDDEVDEGFKRCSDSVSGGWVLLCLSSDDVKHGHLQQRQQQQPNTVQHNYRLQSTKQYFEPAKQSVNNCWGEAEESSGASPTRADVTQVGVGAAKNKVGPKNESQQLDFSHNVAESAADEGETLNVKDDFPIQRREHHQQQQQRLVIETDALTNANCPVVTALQRNDDNDGGNLVRESVRRDHLLPVSVDKLDRVQSVQVAVEDIAVESSSSWCEDAQVRQSLEPKLDTVGLKLSDELKVTNKSLINSSQNFCSTNISDRIGVDGVETSSQEEVIENRKISNFQMFMGNRIKGKSKEKSIVFEEKSTVSEEKPIVQRDKSSVGDKMEILVEKEKDKKKKVGKKSWWFLPKSKQSEPGTVHVTLPFTSSKAATKEKQSGSSSRTNGGEKSSNNGCHGNVSYLDRGDGLRKKEDSDLSELETRLDMETFTNNLWIEFENELKGVWPTAASTNNNHGSSQPKPAVVAASTSATLESAADDKIMVRENNSTSSSGINQRCRDNGQIINEKKEVTSTSVEKNKNSVESVNHVVKGKPPLPSTSASSSAQRNKGKVGLPKIAKKIAVNEENEEVNDPSLVFDKLRQIAKEGRDRAAKSVQDLSEVEETIRDMDQKEISTGSGKDDEEDDISSWSSTPFWSRFRDGEMNRTEADATASDRRCWHDSNQSLVGYLETDIDTFHSREVIRVNPQGEACGSYSSSRREIGGSGLNFGSNVKRHRPVKLKTQSMFNLIDGSGETRKIVNENASLLTPEADADEMTSASSSRAKSMEFLLKAENKAAVEAPENRLMRLRTTNRNGGESGPVTPETEVGMSRSMSEHEDRVRRSLQKLNLPDWYTNSRVNQNGSSEHLRRDGDERRSLRWEDYRNRSNSSSSVFSGNSSNNRARNAVVISKRVMTPDWRNVRSSRESLVQSPSSPANSSTQLDKTDDSCSHIYYNSGLSRWSSSRLSTNSSRSSSPTSGFNTSSNVYRSSLKNQPYLGWRSSERLAAINQSPTVKQTEKPFYRSAAERLSKGPGYYALRFGVYTCHNNSNGGESDISLV